MAVKGRRTGLALVEWLLVVALFVLLAGTVYSLAGGAREKAHQSQCLGNLGQIGAAALLYKADWDGHLPVHLEALFPQYVASESVFLCPSDAAPEGWRTELREVRGVYSSYTQFTDPRFCVGEDVVVRFPAPYYELAVDYAVRELTSRLPIAICWSHLLPGRYYNPYDLKLQTFTRTLWRCRIPSVMPRVDQDGSCRLMKIPEECQYTAVVALYGWAGIDHLAFDALAREKVKITVMLGRKNAKGKPP